MYTFTLFYVFPSVYERELYLFLLPHKAFLEWLEELLPSRNMIYAIRVDGYFEHVKVRSVPKTENYKPLVEVAENQPEFEFNQIKGTIAGFYTPSYLSTVNVPGLHLHFISEDFEHGGHSVY